MFRSPRTADLPQFLSVRVCATGAVGRCLRISAHYQARVPRAAGIQDASEQERTLLLSWPTAACRRHSRHVQLLKNQPLQQASHPVHLQHN